MNISFQTPFESKAVVRRNYKINLIKKISDWISWLLFFHVYFPYPTLLHPSLPSSPLSYSGCMCLLSFTRASARPIGLFEGITKRPSSRRLQFYWFTTWQEDCRKEKKVPLLPGGSIPTQSIWFGRQTLGWISTPIHSLGWVALCNELYAHVCSQPGLH